MAPDYTKELARRSLADGHMVGADTTSVQADVRLEGSRQYGAETAVDL